MAELELKREILSVCGWEPGAVDIPAAISKHRQNFLGNPSSDEAVGNAAYAAARLSLERLSATPPRPFDRTRKEICDELENTLTLWVKALGELTVEEKSAILSRLNGYIARSAQALSDSPKKLALKAVGETIADLGVFAINKDTDMDDIVSFLTSFRDKLELVYDAGSPNANTQAAAVIASLKSLRTSVARGMPADGLIIQQTELNKALAQWSKTRVLTPQAVKEKDRVRFSSFNDEITQTNYTESLLERTVDGFFETIDRRYRETQQDLKNIEEDLRSVDREAEELISMSNNGEISEFELNRRGEELEMRENALLRERDLVAGGAASIAKRIYNSCTEIRMYWKACRRRLDPRRLNDLFGSIDFTEILGMFSVGATDPDRQMLVFSQALGKVQEIEDIFKHSDDVARAVEEYMQETATRHEKARVKNTERGRNVIQENRGLSYLQKKAVRMGGADNGESVNKTPEEILEKEAAAEIEAIPIYSGNPNGSENA